jgi:hypothetical protein
MIIASIKDIQRMVQHIDDVQDDYEVAHSEEDDLYEAVLQCICSGLFSKRECVLMAAEALKTRAFDFARHCA